MATDYLFVNDLINRCKHVFFTLLLYTRARSYTKLQTLKKEETCEVEKYWVETGYIYIIESVSCKNQVMRDPRTKGDNMAAKEIALTIKRNFKRAGRKQVKQFMDLPTGNVCDAQGRIGALDYRIKPVSAMSQLCGTALTVDAGPRDNLAPWAALEIAKPDDIIFITTAEHLNCSVVGDIYAGMAKNAGVAGIVTDGVVRDLSGINEVGIPVFARGISPNSPWKNGPGRVGLPISIGGVAVKAGDIVVGDQDGIVIVAREKAADVGRAIKAVLAKEKQMEAGVQAGLTVPAWLKEAYRTKGVQYQD
jgi:4-hydroxy-4-methyl-2-oxoglutarate aldolase